MSEMPDNELTKTIDDLGPKCDYVANLINGESQIGACDRQRRKRSNLIEQQSAMFLKQGYLVTDIEKYYQDRYKIKPIKIRELLLDHNLDVARAKLSGR